MSDAMERAFDSIDKATEIAKSSMNNLKLVLGGPGCGKTTRLLEIVAQEIANGVSPQSIAFVTFTKAAATEARDRAAAQFNLSPDDLPWFRTIHSLAYARLGITKSEVMDRGNWKEFADVVGETISGTLDASDGPPSGGSREIGDQMLRIVDYAATTLTDLQEAWHQLDEAVDWWRLWRFADALRAYKVDTDKIDFTDMLLRYIQEGKPVDIEVAVIDEAQDLTAAQWLAVRRAFAGAERVYVGGDDDQAIYFWAGADVAQFLSLTETPEVLPVSHRLPRQVHAYASRIASQITARYTKRFAPSNREGSVEWYQYPDSVDLGRDGTWFLLARNTYMLRRLEMIVREAGINYARRSGPSVSPIDVAGMQLWERLRTGKVADMSAREAKSLLKLLNRPIPQFRELQRYTLKDLGVGPLASQPWFVALEGIPQERRDYYLACLRRGERLTKPPRIRIETIHGVKGAEADHVLLMTDLSHRTAHSFALAPDHEHRVFYVGATRALRSLHLVMPQTDLSYPMPDRE